MPSSTISRSWNTHLACLRLIEASIRLKRRRPCAELESNWWLFPLPASSLRNAKPLNTREGFDVGIAGVRASRAELRVYDAIMGGAPAAFTGKTGWSGG